MQKSYRDIYSSIKNSKRMAIISHKGADGDAIGSTIAFEGLSKIINKSLCIDKYVDTEYMQNFKYFVNKYNFRVTSILENAEYDLIVGLDIPAIERIPYKVDLPLDINLDHHKDNEHFGKINIVLSDVVSSTGVIIYDFCKFNGLKLTRDIAEGLYLSILTDTGSFGNANTLGDVFKIADECLQIGVKPALIYKEVYENNSPMEMRLIGNKVYEHETFFNGRLLISRIESTEDLDNRSLIDELRRIAGADLVAVFTDRGEYVKISLRAKNESLNLLTIARDFNGGGHRAAVGCKVESVPIDEAIKIFLEYLVNNNIFK